MGTGGARRKKPRFGSERDQRAITRMLGDPALQAICEVGVTTAMSMASPGPAGLIWTAWIVYKCGKDLAELGQQVESIRARPRSRQTDLALRMGLRAGLRFLADAGVKPSVDSWTSVVVNTTANELTRRGVFNDITLGLGLPQRYAIDLRYLFIAGSTRMLRHAYSGIRDRVIDGVLGETSDE